MSRRLPKPGFAWISVRPTEYDERGLPAWFRVVVEWPLNAPLPHPSDPSLLKPATERRNRQRSS
jgi:hypothetical protein